MTFACPFVLRIHFISFSGKLSSRSSHFSLILGYRLLHPVPCDYITIRWTNKFVAWHSKAVSNFSFRSFNH